MNEFNAILLIWMKYIEDLLVSNAQDKKRLYLSYVLNSRVLAKKQPGPRANHIVLKYMLIKVTTHYKRMFGPSSYVKVMLSNHSGTAVVAVLIVA